MKKKIALVTGASSGIGKSTAIQLQRDGYIVFGASRRLEKMKDLEEKGIHILSLDITNSSSVENCINTIIQKEGRLDVLVNNAGFGNFGTMEESSIEVAKAQYDVNVFGLARITQLVIPYMRKQKYGKIVNISSIGGKIVTPFGGWYQSTKFAVEAISDALRMELKQFGIDVIVIEPGGVKTEWADIAERALFEISGKGPYKESAKKAAKAMKDGYVNAVEPNVIAGTITRAVRAKKPKTRYALGHRAGSILIARKWLSDKMFDKMIMKEFI